MDTENEGIKSEELTADILEAKPASFNGRLQNFIHIPSSTDSSPRRSVRVAATLAQAGNLPPAPKLQTSPSPSPSRPTKRKASPSEGTKRKRSTPRYAPPSTYAHLPPLPDAISPNLLILFIGLNPGIQTASTGHAYAHPSNLFWKLLHHSGVTSRLLPASEDRTLPERYACGFTNIVSRPSRNGAELRNAELDAGVAVLEAKIAKWRPEVACIVGKGIWEAVFRVRKGRGMKKGEFEYGWQEGENMGVVRDGEEGGPWEGARVFVATSTSGLAATLGPREKEVIWGELGAWCTQRRAERGMLTEVKEEEGKSDGIELLDP
ncbi:G/U mismatch-specific uracil DNA glycosylase like protein [Verticillium longisporum]|uniref:G/U mismatch-specific uracil DNA glycosylase like protein n=2 Tax=Verticillium longisporum TaxID=100787 RepID=A0A8I3AYE0_VERLO|nr:G/U mismatch-specific uracil DNA glycosylase like protein [Verticillium longisporum]